MKCLARLLAVAALCFFATSVTWAQGGNARPSSGACFYTDYNFRGHSFCMNAGQSAANMPSGFNDRVKSIRVFGGVQVKYFNDSLFRGANGWTTRDINDLRRYPVPDAPNKTWETRISSVQISSDAWSRGSTDRDGDHDRDRDRDGWYGGSDRDHDRDHDVDRDRDNDDRWHSNTVSCSADVSKDREWCRAVGRVNNVRLVNQNGRGQCEWGRSFGLDDGRLWTAYGCAGTFEVR
jgi:hypothetical protein